MASKSVHPPELRSLGETGFPKISGKKQEFIAGLKKLAESTELPPSLDIEGTVKLHGMHADIVFDLKDLPSLSAASSTAGEEDTLSSITFQSRNCVVTPARPQNDWPTLVSKHPSALIYLRTRILTQFRALNPDTPVLTSHPLIIAGEHIGHKIQKDVGISELSHRFVILAISINGKWQPDTDYAHIEAARANIYSIFRGGKKIVKFDTSDLNISNPALLEMQAAADAAEANCPYASAFGILNSRGEGVVWKPGHPIARSDARYWLKTKGPISDSNNNNRITAANIARDIEQKQTIDEVCSRFVNPRRIEQGFEYLLEMGLEPSGVSVKVFIAWVMKDVFEEERCEIAEMEKRCRGMEAKVKRKVGCLARCAYLEELRRCSGVEGGRA